MVSLLVIFIYFYLFLEEVASEKDFKLQTFKEVNLTTPGSYKTTDASELKALLVEAGLGEHFNNLYGL